MQTKAKSIIGVLIVLLIICVVVFFIMSQREYQKSDFIGTWFGQIQEDEYNPAVTFICAFYDNDSVKIEFHFAVYKDRSPSIGCDADETNNTLTLTSVEQYSHQIIWGNWELIDNKLNITYGNNYTPDCYYKFVNKNKMEFLFDGLDFNLSRTEQTDFNLPETHVKWNNISIEAYIFGDNISYDNISVNLTRSSVSLNLMPTSSENIYKDYAPLDWGEVIVGDVLQFPKDENRYHIEFSYRVSIEPPNIVGHGGGWII